ncbi:MAG: TrmH family RNA methyltransferase, partial [Planctomycetota bacterium]
AATVSVATPLFTSQRPPLITSRQNPRVKNAAALRSRKARDTRGETLVYGPRETLRAMAAGAEVVEVFVCRDLLRGADAPAADRALAASGVEVLETTPEVFDRLAYGDRLDGVVAVVKAPRRGLADLSLPAKPLIAVVEGVEKPGNLGAVLRSADGAGVDAVVLADPVIDLFGPNVIRASVGAVFKSNAVVAGTVETLDWLAGLRAPIYATRPDATDDYTAANFSAGAAIVLGAEATGLTDAWSTAGVTPIRLPMHGIADSLNLSATAAVLFYEALRQRG